MRILLTISHSHSLYAQKSLFILENVFLDILILRILDITVHRAGSQIKKILKVRQFANHRAGSQLKMSDRCWELVKLSGCQVVKDDPMSMLKSVKLSTFVFMSRLITQWL